MIVRVSPRLLKVGVVRGNSVSSLLCSDQGGGPRDCGQPWPGPGPRPRPLAVRAKNADIIFLFRISFVKDWIFFQSLFKALIVWTYCFTMFLAAPAKDFLVLLKAIIPVDKCKKATHDLICLLASLMENLRLVLCTGRPSLPITTMLGFSTLRLSSENRRQR